jgi:hypothetical protein
MKKYLLEEVIDGEWVTIEDFDNCEDAEAKLFKKGYGDCRIAHPDEPNEETQAAMLEDLSGSLEHIQMLMEDHPCEACESIITKALKQYKTYKERDGK